MATLRKLFFVIPLRNNYSKKSVEDIINKLKTMDLNITKEFWYLIRGNIEILDDVKIWMNVCFGNIQTKNIDSDLLSLALKLLPHDQFNENTWSIWTNLLKIESG